MNQAQRSAGRRKDREMARGLQKIAGALQLPAAVVAGTSHMQLCGNREAVLEGCSGIVEYTQEIVRVKTGKFITKFSGRELEIKCLQSDSLVVQGFILAIEFQF